jgi:hypothetical protein
MRIISLLSVSALSLSVFILSCAAPRSAAIPHKDPELLAFAELLTGNFSSRKQAESDSTYLDISLSMSRIWSDRTDAVWLYVEQAVSAKKDKPYRQRVYKLGHPSENIFTSDIYTIRNQQEFAGLQNDPAKQKLLKPDIIDLKEGCTVTLQRYGKKYEGGTDADKCPSDLRGAKYATTKIRLEKGLLVSWDQGFDASGNQVWGATAGGYRFVKE